MRTFALILLLTNLACMAACASDASPRAASQPGQQAECLVCKKNADLACVNITVDDTTPRSIYNGKTYYFCSPECKAAFDKQPDRYIGLSK